MKRLLAGLVLASIFVIGGCGSKDAAADKGSTPAPSPLDVFVGKWEGGKQDSTFTLSVTKDGHFTVDIQGGNKAHSASGNATVKDKLLLLTATTIDGKAPETEGDKKPEEFAISMDGTTLTPVQGGEPLTKQPG